MANDSDLDLDLEGPISGTLVGALEAAFKDPASLKQWFEAYFPGVLPANVFTGVTIRQQCAALLIWAQSEGHLRELLQKLTDNPPDNRLPDLIFVVSGGEITRSSVSNDPRVAPALDGWFVTSRPFVGRKGLRDHLRTLNSAAPGSDSVLIIYGGRSSGKTHGIRLATQCAPPGSPAKVNIEEWGESKQMTAADLAQAIYGYKEKIDDFPPFDSTKEDGAVPRILTWLVSKLKNRQGQAWIIVDHCNRPSLTMAAHQLLIDLALRVEDGSLPGVRLVMADIDPANLPDALAWSRFDEASLPGKEDVEKWCESLAQHARRACSADFLKDRVKEVFPANLAKEKDTPQAFERRVFDAYRKIMAVEALIHE